MSKKVFPVHPQRRTLTLGARFRESLPLNDATLDYLFSVLAFHWTTDHEVACLVDFVESPALRGFRCSQFVSYAELLF
jgi:hypothetical protein